MNLTLKKTLHWAGSGLALVGIAFVAIRLYEYWGSQDLSNISQPSWIAMLCLVMLYGLASMLLALAWRQLLSHFGVIVTKQWAIRTYGISQLARYVPGNITHLVGRQAIGMAAGVAAGVLAMSSIWELGLIVVAGMLYGWLLLPILVPGLPTLVSVTGFGMSVLFVVYILRRVFSPRISVSFGMQVLFLAISGLVFVVLLNVIILSGEHQSKNWALIAGSFVVSWLVGIVTPGAPAGIGIREMVLLFLLKGIVKDADLLMAVLMGRMVTVFGDLLFFSLAHLIQIKGTCKIG